MAVIKKHYTRKQTAHYIYQAIFPNRKPLPCDYIRGQADCRLSATLQRTYRQSSIRDLKYNILYQSAQKFSQFAIATPIDITSLHQFVSVSITAKISVFSIFSIFPLFLNNLCHTFYMRRAGEHIYSDKIF